MTNANMREWVKSAYPGTNWAKKVDKMTDEQVLAIYQRLVQTGKIRGG